jgi:two-component system, OmpR family, KDP operon response regulator KdpE
MSARSSADEKVRLLELGADDCVVKPFGMAELLARIRAAFRRQARGSGGEPIVHAGPLSINLAQRSVTLGNEPVQLSPNAYRLLEVLAQHAGNVVTRQRLLKEVWGIAYPEGAHYLTLFVRGLRKKIEKDATQPRIVTTELGIGYRLAIEND